MKDEPMIKELKDRNLSLLARVYQAREDERRLLAGELHDNLCQQLAGLKMDIYRLEAKLQPTDEFVVRKLTQMSDIVDAAVESIRSLSADLRPEVLEDLGLSAALVWYSRRFERQHCIPVCFDSDRFPHEIDPRASLHLYRLYQILLDSLLTHAKVRSISAFVRFTKDRLELTVGSEGGESTLDGGSPWPVPDSITERVCLLAGEYSQECEPGGLPAMRISIPRDTLLTPLLNPLS